MERYFLLKVAKALKEHKVRYCLVGGFAVALHGAIRGTIDIDAIIEHSLEQFKRCEKALQSIGLVSKLPVSANEVFQFRKEYIKKRNLIAWSFSNPRNPLEVVDIIITTDRNKVKSNPISVFGNLIELISLPDLIQMKEKSGRPQDKEDVKALLKILGEHEDEN